MVRFGWHVKPLSRWALNKKDCFYHFNHFKSRDSGRIEKREWLWLNFFSKWCYHYHCTLHFQSSGTVHIHSLGLSSPCTLMSVSGECHASFKNRVQLGYGICDRVDISQNPMNYNIDCGHLVVVARWSVAQTVFPRRSWELVVVWLL